MNESKIPIENKHHFIPQFYLKYFTDDNGKYYLFDKNNKRFMKNPRTPKSTFYEYNRNTINNFKINDNSIEEIYSSLESDFAKCMKYILTLNNNIEITEIKQIIYVLKCFIAIQFCRLPINDDYFDNFILNYDYKKCRNIIKDNNGNNLFDNNFIDKVKNDIDFRKYFKSLILPFLLFNILEENYNFLKWQIFDLKYSYQDYNLICSDAPIIYKNKNDLFMFNGDIILPLTKEKILIVSKNIFPNKFDRLFWESVNMVLYEQANQYVSVLEKKNLNIIIDRYTVIEKLNMSSYHKENIFTFL